MAKVGMFTAVLVLSLLVYAGSASAQPSGFAADLSGAEEVPPIMNAATGRATFQVSPDGSELAFKVVVANLGNVTASHIHCAARGANGPFGAILSSSTPGPADGISAEGVITAPESGNGCGWSDLAAMLGAMETGNTYVNVHTAANLGGEIRGQIRVEPISATKIGRSVVLGL